MLVPKRVKHRKVQRGSMKGNANIFQEEGREKGYMSTPFDNSGIMASVGFTIGGKDSKGANILRVFYL